MSVDGAPISQQARFMRRLEVFRDRLLQVDWRNRSILLKRTAARWSYDLSARPPADELCAQAVGIALAGAGRVRLVADSDDSPPAQESRKNLTQQARAARLVLEETGLEHTFIGFPFVVGHIDKDHFVRAPLALFPARLVRTRGARGFGWYLEVPEGSTPIVNKALLAAVQLVRGMSLPGDLQERLDAAVESAEAATADKPAALLRALENVLADAGLPIAKMAAEFQLPFVALDALTADVIGQMSAQPLHLVPHVIVGSFPQGSNAIYRDYEDLIGRARGGETDQGIVDDLLEAPGGPAPIAPPPPGIDLIADRELNFALDSDGSQDAVIVEAQTAPCVVVRGPPGTGKSQVIVNLISNAIAKGERVLLVCQKRAALDVVFQRLERAGLEDCAVVLHDSHADRKATYQRLARRMAAKPAAPDAAAEAQFEATTRAIDATVAELNSVVAPLWETYFGGVRLQELYLTAEPGFAPTFSIDRPASDFDVHALDAFLARLPTLEKGARRFDAPASPLAGRKTFAAAAPDARSKFEAALRAWSKAADPKALVLPAQDLHMQLLEDTRRFLKHQQSFLRFLLPSWKRARKSVDAFLASHPGDSRAGGPEQLKVSLEAGVWLLNAWEDLDPFVSEAGKRALREVCERPQDVPGRADGMIKELANFDAIQEHDQGVIALAAPEAALFNAAKAALMGASTPWPAIVRQEVVARWIAAVESAKPQLAGNPFERYGDLRARLATLLEDRRRLLVARLKQRAAASATTPEFPPGEHHPQKRPETDWNKLAYEFGKQRMVKPVRKLLEEYPFQFMRVAPVWLASPEAASDIFPLTRGLFDLVVFDESSQLAVERAVPAVYRGKRVLIAGDEKQLRPFDLFEIAGDDNDDTEEPDATLEAESLLMLARRTFEPRYLSWHYRSKYQELIDFSNHAFYEGNLQIMANVERELKMPPIEFVRAQGKWKERANPAEAEQVVGIVGQLLKDGEERHRTPSLGVITFNDAQRDTILDAVDQRRKADADFERRYAEADSPERTLDERPFVKNIENVQGDERDIILFSVGYAPDESGKVRVQFGSLNAEGGENRLNVAVTRARERVVLVASFDPKVLQVEGTKNLGPKLLKEYLLYAQAVSTVRRDAVAALLQELDPQMGRDQIPPPALSGVKPLEIQVAEAMIGSGLEVQTHVGFSGYKLDMAIVDPADAARFALGVESDGPMFQSASSARERDVARQRMLQSRGWAVDRVWSRNWWRARESELERLRARVQTLSTARASAAPAAVAERAKP